MSWRSRLTAFAILICMLLANTGHAWAFPPLPSSFWGTVKSSGINVPAGSTVSARINGQQYATTTVTLYNGDTMYSLDVPGDDPGTPAVEGGVAGDTVAFYVNNTAAAQTAAWTSGALTHLDLTAANQAPTNISLSKSSLNEAQPIGTLIGTFSTADPDPADSFVYSLVTSGCAGTDNNSFRISGSKLLSNAAFDYEIKRTYQLCVQTDDGHSHKLQKGFVITVLNVPGAFISFSSTAAEDGWILESAAGGGSGGTFDSAGENVLLGDDKLNRQYRSVLSFNTAALPDNALITSVTLQIKRQSLSGGDPFGSMGNVLVDIRKPFFGTLAALQATDFNAPASAGAVGTVLKPAGAVNGSWYSAVLAGAAFPAINLTGTTQLRLRFATPSNRNNTADVLAFYSGNTATAANRPLLRIEYAVPSATLPFVSVGANDGWTLETAAGSGIGGTLDAAGPTFLLGDDKLNRQYRSVLSFNTAPLPDNARLASVILQIRRQSITGNNPFASLGQLLVDTRKPFFGTLLALQAADFNASADHLGLASIPNSPNAAGWYSVTLPKTVFDSINLTGTTQLRLRFATRSNRNNLADLLVVYSGNAATSADRPILRIVYWLP